MKLTLDLDNIETSLRKRLGSHYGYHPDFDDGIQEALIQVWKDIQEGITDRSYLLNRGQVWFTSRVFGENHPWTGTPRREKHGFRKDSAYREKVANFRKEYRELHGEYPTIAETSRGTGLKESTVSYHVKKANTYSSAILTDDGGSRLARKAYIHHSLSDVEGETMESFIGVEGFEDAVIGESYFNTLVTQLDERARMVITLRYCYAMSNSEIGQQLWPEEKVTISRQRVNKAMKRGMTKLKELVQ
jgi:RNA polymerase sigma factor (sigma-70 family)